MIGNFLAKYPGEINIITASIKLYPLIELPVFIHTVLNCPHSGVSTEISLRTIYLYC